MSAVRPLPSRPSLEFEHKEAKAFLRQLRSGKPDALARARAQLSATASTPSNEFRLADAQRIIAREYGFASWPKLVRYYGDVHRQSYNLGSARYNSHKVSDQHLLRLLEDQRSGRPMAARMIAAYVPRFYGMRIEEIVGAPITENEGRLAVARSMGFSSWDLALARGQSDIHARDRDMTTDPMRDAANAIRAHDLASLQRVIEDHPDLLNPSDVDIHQGRSLLRSAFHWERSDGTDVMRPIMDWLAARGLDLQVELNRQLCGHMHIKADKVSWLLDRGADPAWIPPNGIPILEHALIRYWNGEAVDALAARCKPRPALWISAGLGDIDGVRRFLDSTGKPTPAARKIRPDFDAVGPGGMLSHPDPDDEEILLEAFFIAMLNGRTKVLEYMVSRGLPVNSLVWGTPVLNVAAGNAWVPVVECLLKCGADPDLTGWGTRHSARDMAHSRFADDSQSPTLRRLVEILGLNPDAIIAERDARSDNSQ